MAEQPVVIGVDQELCQVLHNGPRVKVIILDFVNLDEHGNAAEKALIQTLLNQHRYAQAHQALCEMEQLFPDRM